MHRSHPGGDPPLRVAAETVGQGVVLLAAYSAGRGIPFLLSGLAINKFFAAFSRLRAHMKAVEVVSGGLLVAVGALGYGGTIYTAVEVDSWTLRAQLVDLNLDGLLDLAVVNRWETAQLWRQTGALDGGWVQVRLQQDGPNRDAIGSVIEIRRGDKVERHEIASGGGHVSGSVGWLHFGLGTSAAAEMRVLWPDGTEGDWLTLSARSFQILRPDQAPETWTAE